MNAAVIVLGQGNKIADTRNIFDFSAENAKVADCLAEQGEFELSGDFISGQ
jgi:hypothetical protein